MSRAQLRKLLSFERRPPTREEVDVCIVCLRMLEEEATETKSEKAIQDWEEAIEIGKELLADLKGLPEEFGLLITRHTLALEQAKRQYLGRERKIQCGICGKRIDRAREPQSYKVGSVEIAVVPTSRLLCAKCARSQAGKLLPDRLNELRREMDTLSKGKNAKVLCDIVSESQLEVMPW